MFSEYKVAYINNKLKLIGLLNQLSLKERLVTVFCVAALVLGLFYVIKSIFIDERLMQSEVLINQTDAITMSKQAEIDNLKRMLKQADISEKIEKYTSLKTQENVLTKELKELGYKSHTTKELTNLLNDMLSNIQELRILKFVSINEVDFKLGDDITKDVESNMESSNTKKKRAGVVNTREGNKRSATVQVDNNITQPNVYSRLQSIAPSAVNLIKKDYLISLEGRFFDILDYLSSVENKNWGIYWYELDYKVKKEPVAIVDIKFYTLKKRV